MSGDVADKANWEVHLVEVTPCRRLRRRRRGTWLAAVLGVLPLESRGVATVVGGKCTDFRITTRAQP